MDFKKLRVEARRNDTSYVVQGKGLFGWYSGYVNTDYFSMEYPTREEAEAAIHKYLNRFSYVEQQ